MAFSTEEILELHEEVTGVPGGLWLSMCEQRLARERWRSRRNFARWIAKGENLSKKRKYMKVYDRLPRRVEAKRLRCAKRRKWLKESRAHLPKPAKPVKPHKPETPGRIESREARRARYLRAKESGYFAQNRDRINAYKREHKARKKAERKQ